MDSPQGDIPPHGALPMERASWARRMIRTVLGVPLAAKLAGANMLVILGAGGAILATQNGTFVQSDARVIVGLALAVTFLVNAGLMVLALRPLQELERIATRVQSGELHARVRQSLLSDSRVARVGETMNLLLDGLVEDRARARRLAAEVIEAADRERATIARELHDSVAQSLIAIQMQLSVAERDSTDSVTIERLESIRAIGTSAIEEVRMIAHTMHPRVLEDLGFVASLQYLARETMKGSAFNITVETSPEVQAAHITPATGSVLYRVAQEAVSNAVRHSQGTTVRMNVTIETRRRHDDPSERLQASVPWVVLSINDDGIGFDVADAERRRPGMGLFTMRERVALVDGVFELVSNPHAGTRVMASLPLEHSANTGIV